jgi:hypothetical protein
MSEADIFNRYLESLDRLVHLDKRKTREKHKNITEGATKRKTFTLIDFNLKEKSVTLLLNVFKVLIHVV